MNAPHFRLHERVSAAYSCIIITVLCNSAYISHTQTRKSNILNAFISLFPIQRTEYFRNFVAD